ncbi:MAG TPA: site-specific integrase [Rhodoferax sp.]|nr:site-specific integrase [Rhodoferax sp.]
MSTAIISEFDNSPSPKRRQRSFRLLELLLPNDPEVLDAVLQNSRDALSIADRWLGLACVEILESRTLPPSQSHLPQRLEDYPVATLFSLETDAGQVHGFAALKALLIVDKFTERRESDLFGSIVSGLRKSAGQRNNWRSVLPPRPPDAFGLLETVEFCHEFATQSLNKRTDHNEAQQAWLTDLERWTDLLKTPAPRFLWIFKPIAAPEETPEADPELNEIDDDRENENPLVWVSEPESDVDPDPEKAELDEPSEPELPVQSAPEAPTKTGWAKPNTEGEPETCEGAEARGARTGFRSALENQRLKWANDQLVARDVFDLVEAIKKELTTLSEAEFSELRNAAGIVGLAMAFGARVEEVMCWPLRFTMGITCFEGLHILSRLVPTPQDAWSPDSQQSASLLPATGRLRLEVPIELALWLEQTMTVNEGDNLSQVLDLDPVKALGLVRSWLYSLRAQNGGGQTLGRVERWLAFALYQDSLDHVKVHLLCADSDSTGCPAAYYRAYTTTTLEDLHRKTISRAGWTVGAVDTGSNLEANNRWVGSALNPKPEAVAQMWRDTTAHFESIVSDPNKDLCTRHNAREIHEVFSLIFQTFHRIVSDPLESLELLDLEHRRIIIDDKHQGNSQAHRLIPLGKLAVTQCEDQIEHLWSLASAVQSEAPETFARIVKMLSTPSSRTAPFRFLLNKKLEVIRITPAALLDALKSVWPFPLNISRHLGATWLLQDGATDRQICSLLGHHDLGTLELSPLSPNNFEDLFGDLRPKIDGLIESLGLRPIRTFLPPSTVRPSLRGTAKFAPMHFGYMRREAKRAQVMANLRAGVGEVVKEQLAGRSPASITQDDVNLLFKNVSESGTEGRTQWPRYKAEALREWLVTAVRQFPELKIELPAGSIAIKDVAHTCSMDSLAKARWLSHLRAFIKSYWLGEFSNWRRQQDQSHSPSAAAVVATLLVECLVIDLEVWNLWLETRQVPDTFIDQSGRAWLRMALRNGNSRLYPIRRDLAELTCGVPQQQWKSVALEDAIDWVRAATADFVPKRKVPDFRQLLEMIRSALAPDTPGMILSYADGTNGVVSPEEICLERADGLGPTLNSVNAWNAIHKAPHEDPVPVARDSGKAANAGKLKDVAAFRREMSNALGLLGHQGSQRKRDKSIRINDSAVQVTDQALQSTSKHSKLGPINRFKEHLEEHWDNLVGSKLTPTCALSVRWMHSLASDGKRGGSDYAPKTLKNYWYSWALRMIEELGPIDPRSLSASDIEEIYLQIVEDADLEHRQHLYAPMRNLHRYLVENHGTTGIEWSELQAATGQGLARIDANLVHESEYLCALNLLRNDETVQPRVRAMQAVALVLVYRCGLRISEALGLRDGDLYCHSDRWHVRLARNRFRRLKTDSSRRTVPILEDLTLEEQQLLQVWDAHIRTCSFGREIKPLFSAGGAGEDRRQLFPRRTIALRISQALRIATRDPSTRVHHCRHSFASRILKSTDFIALLTSETISNRRWVWAVSALLGHSSPLTTLQSYFHAGHELLLQWCKRDYWELQKNADPVEWHAFSSGGKLKTMQRARQRANSVLTLEKAMSDWTRVRRCAEGTRIPMNGQLGAIPQPEVRDTIVKVDQVIDHARRFGHVDGLGEHLFLDERLIQRVLIAADKFARSKVEVIPPEGFFWTESEDRIYKDHEIEQIEDVLQAVEGARGVDLAAFASVVERLLAPAESMIAIEQTDDLLALAEVVSLFVYERKHIEVLMPADSKLRQALPVKALRSMGTADGQSTTTPATARPGTKPRFMHVAVSHLTAAKEMEKLASDLGFTAVPHARVAGARESRHSNQSLSDRVGLSIARKAGERTRSAKVFTRIASSIAVSVMASRLSTE